jgi:WD40 repeat protein
MAKTKGSLFAFLSLVFLLEALASGSAAEEPVILRGHERWVSGLAFAPDGRFLASGSFDGSVKLWDPATGKELLTLRGHSGAVTGIALSPDGKTLASAGGQDLTVRLWDVPARKEKAVLTGHTKDAWAVAFSPDGKTVASSSMDKTIRLWDVASGKEVRNLAAHTGLPRAVAFSPDGRDVISCDAAGIHLWDATTGKERTHARDQGPALCLAVAPDGKALAIGIQPVGPELLPVGPVVLWDPATGKDQVAWAVAFRSVVSAVAFSPDGKTLATGGWEKSVQLWDVAQHERLVFLGSHADHVTTLAFSPDGKMLASASSDKTIRLWDVPKALEKSPGK